VSKPNAILVPQRAVQQGPKGTVVYAIGDGNKVQVRDVKATVWRGNDWLIEDGLRPGERIMVDGFQRVTPGTEVKPVTSAASKTTSDEPASPASASPKGTQ
jgi:membrane fusion protein (multidrug efflux system)